MTNPKKIKTVLVTGSSKGIGKAIAKQFCSDGYNVFICARNLKELKKTASEIKATGYFSIDLTEKGNCKKIIDNIINTSGRLDILINNAGEYVYAPIEKTTEIDMERLININIKAPYLLSKYAVKHMKKNRWGRIINIGSISGVVGEANASLYSLTKSCFNGFSKSLGLELAEYNITVNTINPGWVQTDLAQDAVKQSDFSFEEEIEMIPQKRFIQPEEIAKLAQYLACEDAKGMTAQSISLCAGLSAG